LLLAVLVATASCGSSPGPTPADPDQAKPVPTIKTEPVVVHGYSSAELVAEFERARSFLLVDRFADAAEAFDRLSRLATDHEIAATSLYNAAVAYEGLGDRDSAVKRLQQLASAFPAQPVTKNGLVRLSRLLGYLERWSELVQVADQLLRYGPALAVMDRIEGFGAKALGLVEQGKVDEAHQWVNRAHALIDEHRFGEGGAPPIQLAQVAFALGEIRRIRSERIHLVLVKDGQRHVPPGFVDVLERRCQGLLDAQSAYTEAMRARDAHGSAMSGYRVGQLYQQLHREAMQIPTPAKATTLRKKQLFEAAMRLRYRILLEKGLKMMGATVRMGERTGESSFWITRAREAKRDLERALADERAALAKMPFTEDDIRAALEKLKQDTKAKSTTP
jgi:tetratricopeptide (TPR) repeat protein